MKRRVTRKATSRSKYSIKPEDLGFDTETATELAPKSKILDRKKTPSKTTTTRQNLGIYPGE